MPEPKNEIKRPALLRKLAGLVQSNMDSLYRSTYFSAPSDRNQLKHITDDINTTIRDIMTSSSDTTGQPLISKLYERMFSRDNQNNKVNNEFEAIFGNNEFVSQLTSSYLDNRWVRTVDLEIDQVCKYMTKLDEALNVLEDNVLSADSFQKDFLNLTNDIGTTDSEQFSKNIEILKDKYELIKLNKDILD